MVLIFVTLAKTIGDTELNYICTSSTTGADNFQSFPQY
jgi:hypothetical protein